MNGGLISDSVCVAETLADYFSKVSNSANYDNDFRVRVGGTPIPEFSSDNSEYYNIPFSGKELSFALSKTNNNSPGEDLIQVDLIKRLPFEMFY